MQDEIWRPVVGYEGLYEVSDLGRVRSLDRMVDHGRYRAGHRRLQRGRVLRPGHSGRKGNQYRVVQLCCEGAVLARTVHLIVLDAFRGPCPEGMEGCHGDGDREHNTLANLRYDTPAANQADRVKHGTDQLGENNASAKLTTEDVRAIRACGGSREAVADVFGVNGSTISKIRRRERWVHV